MGGCEGWFPAEGWGCGGQILLCVLVVGHGDVAVRAFILGMAGGGLRVQGMCAVGRESDGWAKNATKRVTRERTFQTSEPQELFACCGVGG